MAAAPPCGDGDQQLLDAFFQRARRLRPSIAPIGSSDFQVSPSLAACRTFIFARKVSAADVIGAIRAGRRVAVGSQDRRYGDQTLIELISTPSSRVTDAHPYWRRLSLALAWIGLSGMLLLREQTTQRRVVGPADTSRVEC